MYIKSHNDLLDGDNNYGPAKLTIVVCGARNTHGFEDIFVKQMNG